MLGTFVKRLLYAGLLCLAIFVLLILTFFLSQVSGVDATPLLSSFVPLVVLVAGVVLVLSGLDIFKMYTMAMGFVLFGAVGLLVGALITNSANRAVPIAFLSAIVGAIIAWPLRRLIAFLVTGLFASIIPVPLLLASHAPQAAYVALMIIFFLLGGFLSIRFYEHVVVAQMAYVGSQTIYDVIFLDRLQEALSHRSLGVFQEFIALVHGSSLGDSSARFFVACLFCVAGLYSQKILSGGKPDAGSDKGSAMQAQRAMYVWALLSILWHIPTYFGGSRFFDMDFFGTSIFSWPVAGVISGVAIRLLRNKWHVRYLLFFLVNMAIAPLASWCCNAVMYQGEMSFVYYKGFFEGAGTVLVAKWAYIFLMPFIAVTFTRRSRD